MPVAPAFVLGPFAIGGALKLQTPNRGMIRQSETPVIHIRKPSNTSLYKGIYTEEGVPTCIGMVPMEYVGTNKDGHHLYRCRRDGCHLKDSPNGGIRHCDTVTGRTRRRTSASSR